MEEMNKKQGMFSWNELMTDDVEAAMDFYSRLLGWEYEAQTMADDMVYNIIKMDGKYIGGIMAHCEQSKGMPPMWGSYVSVDDVDSSVAKVESLSGKVLLPPQDIAGVGRFAVIKDAQGAVLTLITYSEKK